MDKINMFFSWASEHPENKQFILKVMKKAKQELLADGIDVTLQESTSDTLGFVKIEDVILDRIERCDYFVADLTPTNTSDKAVVNSNVCFELGYMVGRHGVERVIGMCNIKNLKNPSADLPFDFSHNRVQKIKTDGTAAEKEANISKYANVIKQSILGLKQNGNLYAWKPLKEHDEIINKQIVDGMEHFIELVEGAFEYLDVYSGPDSKNDIPGDFDFMGDLLRFMEKESNKFADASLEVFRTKLMHAVRRFIYCQTCYTDYYFLDIGSNRRCTKMYLINTRPDKCAQYRFPDIINIDSAEHKKEFEPYLNEEKEYRAAAHTAIQCYRDLEDRYRFLIS